MYFPQHVLIISLPLSGEHTVITKKTNKYKTNYCYLLVREEETIRYQWDNNTEKDYGNRV